MKGIPGALINAQNYGLQGDVAVEQQNYAAAVKFYEKAVAAADNNMTAPMYLRKAGLAEQAQGNTEKAAAYYERILTSYPASMEPVRPRNCWAAQRNNGDGLRWRQETTTSPNSTLRCRRRGHALRHRRGRVEP